jgi:hypothetical protein
MKDKKWVDRESIERGRCRLRTRNGNGNGDGGAREEVGGREGEVEGRYENGGTKQRAQNKILIDREPAYPDRFT